jgi:hypothetical protein
MNTPVTGIPRALLRIEGLAVFVAALVGFQIVDASWRLFALLFLIPDVALVAYVGGPRIGALAYNAVHTYVAPGVLAALAYLDVLPGASPLCLVWLAHIGMDRFLGLGLKFPSAFRDTHLGTVGRVVPTA